MYFNNSETDYVGLFGKINTGSIVDGVGIKNSYINGKSFVGGIVGYIDTAGKVTNCYNTGSVIGEINVGGIAGYAFIATTANCYNTGVINGITYVGGIVGSSTSSTVENNNNSGTISGTDENVGGIAGYSYGTIANSYNTGTVNAGNATYVGGIAGYAEGGNIIKNSYNTGSVIGATNVGGIAGYNYYGGRVATITNCYNTGTISGNTDIGSITGEKNNSEVTNSYYLSNSETDEFDGTTFKTVDSFSSGEVAYLLGEAFGQTIGTDELPVLGGTTVYQITKCNGEVVKYSNTNEIIGHDYKTITGYDATCTEDGRTDEVKCSICGDVETPAEVIPAKGHKFDNNGFCTVCENGYQPAVDSDNDGYYEIDSASKLYWFAQQVNSGNTAINVILTADIVVNEGEITENSTDARVWIPIGNNDNKFNGIFNGGNYIVSGLYFNNQDAEYVGLFGYTGENSEIKNVGVVNSYFKGNNCVGGVVGYSYLGTVTNCYNTGTISGNENVGGVVGINNGTVTNCYNTGTISGNEDVGGVVGENAGTVTNCYNKGTVSGIVIFGGVVGYSYLGTVTNCYNTGSVSGNRYVGGVVGFSYKGTVTNSYNTGTVSGNVYVGGVAGNNEKVTITNCYYLDTTYAGGINGTDIAGSAEAKTAEQFANGEVAYLLGEVFGQTIGTDEHPVLGGKIVYQVKNCNNDDAYSNTNETIGHKFDNGICTVCGDYEPAIDSDNDSYYEIDNAGKLYWFAQQVNSGNTSINAILTADITVNEGEITENSTNAREWTPIGSYDNRYIGVFDGNNKTISGLYFNYSSANVVGLFGYTGKNIEIKNVGVVNSYFKGNNYVGGVVCINAGTVTNCYNTGEVNGSSYVGGVVGYSDNAIITNCYNTGTVSGSGRYVGGVIGLNYYDSTIENCYNTGTVSGHYYVGGVVGCNDGETIENCYNTGTVSGSERVGGVVGYSDNAIITNCYNTGTVSGDWYAGGVVGYSDNAIITNCYNTGTVSGDWYAGGVVGLNTDGTVTNCYNKGKVSGDECVGGVVGYNSGGTVTNCYNTGKVSGDTYVGGVVGYNSIGTVTNCYNKGTVSGNKCIGGVVGYNSDSTITNCYYLNTACTGGIKGADVAGSAEAKTAEQFAGGEVAYLLGEAFGQTIGTDELPVLGGAKVYQVKNCKNDIVKYSNTDEIIGHVHETVKGYEATCEEDGLTDGVKCSVCGEILTEQEVIPSKGHTHETVKGYDATCTKSGLTDEVKCSVCGDIKTPATVIPANGHNYNANGYCTECGEKAPVPNEPNNNMLYFKPSSNWYNDGARFVAYVWSDNAEKLIDLYDTDGDGYYEFENDNNWENVIFCRHSSSTQTSWDNVWNQTDDLVIPTDGNNCYTLAEGSWSNGNGTWSKYSTSGQDYPINNKLYFKPNSNWYNDGARFVAYVWSDNAEKLIDLYDTDGDGYYEFINDNNWQNVIFCRHSSSTQTNWDNVWNQTNDLVIPTDGNNCYTLAEGAWSNGNGTWSKYGTPLTYDMGDIDLDGIVTIRDVSLLTKYLVACEALTTTQLKLVDVNGDGYININDATYIQKIIAEII